MSKFRIWTADGSSKDVSRKLLTRVHATRPKKSFYSKLRYQPIIDDEGNEDANKRRDRIPLSRLRRPKTLHYSAVDDDDSSTLDDDEEEEEVCNDFDEMNRHRQRKRSRSCGDQNCDRRVRDWEIDFVDREIEEGDTLCSLALRYGCKMSEIKRVNNLINDQEFYGLRKIKVPVKKHSFTKEQLEREVEEGRRRRLLDESLHAYTSKNVDDGRVENGGDTLERVICVRNSRDSKKFLQTMDEDLERIRQKVKIKKDSLEEVARSLTRKRFRPIVARERPGGRHWDIPKVHCLVVVAVVTLVAFPIILYLLLAHWKANS